MRTPVRDTADQGGATADWLAAPVGDGATTSRWALLLTVALVASLLSPASAFAQQAQNPTIALGGTVSAEGGADVSGIRVTAFRVGHGLPASIPNSEGGAARPRFFEEAYRGPYVLLDETTVDSLGQWSLTVVDPADPTEWFSRLALVFWDPSSKLAITTKEFGRSDQYGWSDQTDLAVEMEPGGSVSGRFVSDSKPLPPGNYGLWSWDRGDFLIGLSVDLESGDFMSPAVAAGTYYVAYSGLEGYASHPKAGSADVVAGQTVDTGTIELKKAASMSGRVTDSSGRGVAGVLVTGRTGNALPSSFGWRELEYGARWNEIGCELCRVSSSFGIGANYSFRILTDTDGTYSVDNLHPEADWQVGFTDITGNTLQFYDDVEPRPRCDDPDGYDENYDPCWLPDMSAVENINLIDTEDVEFLSGRSVSGIDAQLTSSVSVHSASVAALWKRDIISDADFNYYYYNYGSEDLGCASSRHDYFFCPSGYITRRDMAVWLVRALDGKDPPDVDASRFEDVFADGRHQRHASYVERLADLEVTLGCRLEPLSFCPDDPVTRVQMASFLVRAFELPAAEPAGFTDTADRRAAPDIDALAQAGITLGCRLEPLSYCPGSNVARGQMATFLARALKLIPTG